MRKLVYFVGMSIDGFIAGPGGEVDFYPVTPDVVEFLTSDFADALPTHVRGHLGVDAPNSRFDVCVQGRVTYEPALEIGVTSPYAHLRQLVVSDSLRTADPAVEVVPVQEAVRRVRELKAEDGLDVYLAGGGRLAGALLAEIDSLVIKLYPVVAGAGVPLFRADFSPTSFTLTGSRALAGGTVILSYDKS